MMKKDMLNKVSVLLVALLMMAGCVTQPPQVDEQFLTADISGYRLNTGDQIKITIFGEDDLSGEYEIDGTGRLALPLAGEVFVRDKTAREAEDAIIELYSKGYLKDPKITVQVTNYRPFYILGEVQAAGSYPYVNGINVFNAVALGGGFTYRADRHDITIQRPSSGDNSTSISFKASLDTPVLPGDIIEVDERLF